MLPGSMAALNRPAGNDAWIVTVAQVQPTSAHTPAVNRGPAAFGGVMRWKETPFLSTPTDTTNP